MQKFDVQTDAFTTHPCRNLDSMLKDQYRLPLAFWPELPYPAAHFVYDSLPTCSINKRLLTGPQFTTNISTRSILSRLESTEIISRPGLHFRPRW